MDKLFESLPQIITAAAQSYLGILALLCIALSVLAYFFFAKASEKARIVIFILLFLGVVGFGVAVLRESHQTPAAQGSAKAALSKEAKTLLKGAAADPSGQVLFERYGASVDLHTNGVSLLTSKADHRELALWESAVQELVNAGLLNADGGGGEVFEITKQGYDVAAHTELAAAEKQ
jgi:hypothetical protein